MFNRNILQGALAVFGLGVTDMDFSDAPGGDLDLDSIFGDGSKTPTTVETTPEAQPTPAATTPAEPLIKTKTGTVYKSVDDAISGIEHKDALIAQLRDQIKTQTGNDPLTQRKPAPTGPKSYLEDQEQYFDDIAKAVTEKNTKAYMEAQQKLIWDSLGPLAPTITALSKANAERIVSTQIPEFKGFLESDNYSQLATEAPLLADAIRAAELNPQAASQLPELYKVAYLVSQGRRVPELVKNVRVETPSQPRPTVHSTQVPPPATTGQPVAQPGLETKEGRKALIERAEGQGIMNLRW